MNKNHKPNIDLSAPRFEFGIARQAAQKWTPMAAQSSGLTFDIFDPIDTESWWGETVSAKKIADFLKQANGEDVTFRINSPGGNVYEGITIYNLLSMYEGNVTIQILGIAASAASVIAMAGNTVQICDGAFLMIHNCWGLVVGNRHDMRKNADDCEVIDKSMVEIYSKRTGIDADEIEEMMDDETFINASDAVEMGFADEKIEREQENNQPKPASAAKKLDALLASLQLTRSERKSLMKDFKGMPSAAESDMPGAVETNELDRVLYHLKK